jgi:hypothetical protein
MGFLRFVVWTGLCVALGMWLASARVAGKTPIEHAQRLWTTSPALDDVKRDAQDLVSDVKKKVTPPAPRPKEQHSAEDKAAIDDIIARRPAKR